MSGHACPQCRTPAQQRFFCSDCLSQRIEAHHEDLARVQAARDTVQAQVELLLGSPAGGGAATYADLPDPFAFGEPEPEPEAILVDGRYGGATHAARLRRAERAALSRRVALQREALQAERTQVDTASSALHARRTAIARRRANLRAASRAGLAGTQHQPEPPPPTTRNRSVLGALIASPFTQPRETHDEEHEEVVEALKGAGLAEELRILREEVRTAETKAEQVADELARTRAILAREAFSVFDVRPPSASIAAAHPPTSREQRSRDRYSLGSLSFMSGSSTSRGEERRSAAAASDWTINGFVLPLPTDLRRFARDETNAAVAHTVHLLQLLCAYLGVELPFVLLNVGGALHIRPSSLWSGTRASKQPLYLSSAAYTSLTSSPSAGIGIGSGGGGGLGASTLSTLESFVQLPAGSHFSWGLTSMLGGAETEGGGPHGATEDTASHALRAFSTALSMLSYDVAYLCGLQGVRVELLSAASPALRLLWRAVGSAALGVRAHANSASSAQRHIPDLAFDVEWTQWGQVHEMPSAAGGKAERARKGKAAPRGIEESYVDAEEIVRDLKMHDADASARKTTSASPARHAAQRRPAAPAPPPRPGLASSRIVPPAPAATTTNLDFLRRRAAAGGDAGASASTKAPPPRTAGAVIFNGVEIGARDAPLPRERARRKSGRAAGVEESWDVL